MFTLPPPFPPKRTKETIKLHANIRLFTILNANFAQLHLQRILNLIALKNVFKEMLYEQK